MNSKVPSIASILTVAITVAASSAYANFDEFEWTGVAANETSAFEAEYPEADAADATAEADTSDAPLTYFPASLFPEALSYEVDEYLAAERPLDIVAAIDPLQVP